MFELPLTTVVNRNIPKNVFEKYMNSKQKKIMTSVVGKIKWVNKLSAQTINLDGDEIKEIQVFEIQLKQKQSIQEVTTVIDRTIPYSIIFQIRFDDEILISTSRKHIHPTNENQSVIDWVFESNWINSNSFPYKLNLQKNLDFIYSDLCFQISGNQATSDFDIKGLVATEQQKKQLTDQIQKLESAIKNTKKFSKKVELNVELNRIFQNYKK
jgi:hypothetical protein